MKEIGPECSGWSGATNVFGRLGNGTMAVFDKFQGEGGEKCIHTFLYFIPKTIN